MLKYADIMDTSKFKTKAQDRNIVKVNNDIILQDFKNVGKNQGFVDRVFYNRLFKFMKNEKLCREENFNEDFKYMKRMSNFSIGRLTNAKWLNNEGFKFYLA